ncbi:lytic murein transglycosylase [Mesorhizobium sp. M2D.F.Ca.ET.185.01.1.1]|nr:lytic murein transglycosylase [Mesorhizobium sp. M2D.F.Ca.ET.140.01.1.1]TGP15506.1 lytic murein transglycosylase [Mesorhizobium sp. M2D.F.Ca.ET.233.01.1.1]TGP30718.1 lytic murein transglycosylase [Mesorhizobium sp. M2D.F.Ca.ET.232.01.1.1]TGP48215.1 lytic murein transglycosylase [bacterium M00.F.Ca.ET.230.01.1.1]TGP56101.1 lytic murein transglycosylase [Mesorhizobium sp. M2D.F.Ca.ET.226.01.1.1]TGP64083.1 lytic murein transglycosylase [Mesorhizobium sp. M2D.F.Ca.ET.225.01.1.1]TGP73573.1 lyti
MARGPPLCPTGHLPLKGGDQMSRRLSPITNVEMGEPAIELPISPLEGEMPGRAERGAKDRRPLKPVTPTLHRAKP